MLSNNYEKIAELKDFLTNKIVNSEKLNKKHKRYILTHKILKATITPLIKKITLDGNEIPLGFDSIVNN